MNKSLALLRVLKSKVRCYSQAMSLQDVDCLNRDNDKKRHIPTLVSPHSPISFNKKPLVPINHASCVGLQLSQEQRALVQKMHEGHNIYFTGIWIYNCRKSWIREKFGYPNVCERIQETKSKQESCSCCNIYF